MINLQKLRLGNYVDYWIPAGDIPVIWDNKDMIRVLHSGGYSKLFMGSQMVCSLNTTSINGRPAHDYEGITLTSKWLTRFGFLHRDQKYYKENWIISFERDNVILEREKGFINLRYVHELQNLFFDSTAEYLTITGE